MEVDHYPDRPTWLCRVDGDPWPCAIARADLAARLSPTYLTLYMSGFYPEAAAELPASENAWERMIGWTVSADVAALVALADERLDG